MSQNVKFSVVRHLQDQNALLSHAHDGPLVPGQEHILDASVQTISREMKANNKNAVRIIYTNKTNRIRQTAEILAQGLEKQNIPVSLVHEKRLEVMDQGDLNLPKGYKDGDWFTPLDKAWDAICDEAYLYDNIFYKFGDPKGKGGNYPELGKAFSRRGESMGWCLINKYSLINDVVEGNLGVKDNEFLVIACQSDLPLILMELQQLSTQKDVNAQNLPEKSWEVYKQGGLQDKMGFDIPMGYTKVFDLTDFKDNGFVNVVAEAGRYLEGKAQNEKNQMLKKVLGNKLQFYKNRRKASNSNMTLYDLKKKRAMGG